MFDLFRKHTKIMMMVMFLLIIPSFVLFGLDGYSRRQPSDKVVADVAGQDITQAQWDGVHKAQSDRMRESMPNLDAKMFDSAYARYASLEQLVHDRVTAVAAEKFHLFASDARLARFLQEDATIASLRLPNGKMDMERYRRLAAAQGVTPEGFENNVRLNLAKQQVEAGVRNSAFATPALAAVALNAYFEQREVQVLNFQSADYLTKVHPTDVELQTYYDAHSDMFQAAEQAHIEYVVLDLESVKKSIVLPESELKLYYEQNASRLSGKEERRASHILIVSPKDAPAVERQKAKSRAEELLKAVRSAPQNFAEFAKKNSQDPGSAAQGGDLNFFGRGAMVKPFEDAVFAMKKGGISGVVESDFGYHIIQLTDVKMPHLRSFEDLRPSIEADLKTQQAQHKYAEAAELFTNLVYEQSNSLKPVADKLNLAIKTDWQLGRQPQTGSVVGHQKFLDAIFSADSIEKKHNTEVIEIAPNQLIAGRVIEHHPARKLPFAEVRAQVQQRVTEQQATVLAQRDGKLALLKKNDKSVTMPAPVLVSRQQSNKVPHPVVQAAMRADTTSLPVTLGVSLGDQGYAVVRVTKVVHQDHRGTAKQDSDQYVAAWSAAEGLAYYDVLKQAMKASISVPKPGLQELATSK
jgi:peptidyl-prolyl cis-trans isomerase D